MFLSIFGIFTTSLCFKKFVSLYERRLLRVGIFQSAQIRERSPIKQNHFISADWLNTTSTIYCCSHKKFSHSLIGAKLRNNYSAYHDGKNNFNLSWCFASSVTLTWRRRCIFVVMFLLKGTNSSKYFLFIVVT